MRITFTSAAAHLRDAVDADRYADAAETVLERLREAAAANEDASDNEDASTGADQTTAGTDEGHPVETPSDDPPAETPSDDSPTDRFPSLRDRVRRWLGTE